MNKQINKKKRKKNKELIPADHKLKKEKLKKKSRQIPISCQRAEKPLEHEVIVIQIVVGALAAVFQRHGEYLVDRSSEEE